VETLGLTVEQAAAELTLHPRTVRELIRTGQLRSVRVGRRHVISAILEIGSEAVGGADHREALHQDQVDEGLRKPILINTLARADRAS
jgi:excisionase family DNA binding protein